MNEHENERTGMEDPAKPAAAMSYGDAEEAEGEAASSSNAGDGNGYDPGNGASMKAAEGPRQKGLTKTEEKKREKEHSDSVEESVIHWQKRTTFRGASTKRRRR